ncbi:sterol desaturase family protein [Bradyrhizobium sp. sBnM-33]|uniref:sterol desaturase family protein n=1 Tax=Bradyrhizobium sp. sBnM-33 TaxID=2831780 RepID=UPI001BCC26D7|nr:sterol desaturase family protein [Bradyrhizobium sp. sBnM-33]WOH52477.1 sterol desaturase family protein [Bradyrhizobium sp. sBnM-33]
MDDTLYGTRDKRGSWTPNKRPTRAPVFLWPVQPKKILVWLFGYPGYLWPWTAGLFAISFVSWTYLTPSLETMREFGAGWVSLIFLRNAALAVLVYGGFHTLLYIQRRQQTDFKYNAKWPDPDNSAFMFGSQTAENVFLTMCSGVPVWTVYEVFAWWMFANGYISYLDLQQHPVYFIALLLLVPMWASLHFYLIHRLIHIRPLYHIIHKVHHKNVNPGPWSGLSMHTFEHIIYFSGFLIYFVVPSHPLHAMFWLMVQALVPARGHLGFDRIVTDEEKFIDTDGYNHYLHHKYFEVNYGDRLVPLDEWCGTAHDGSPEADEAMYKRLKARKCSPAVSH